MWGSQETSDIDYGRVLMPINVNMDLAHQLPDWHVYPMTATSVEPRGRRQKLNAQMYLAREANYFVKNVMLPLGLISTLGFSVYAIRPEVDMVGDRLEAAFTILLTTVSYKFFIADYLPKVPYLTMLDKYILACLILLVTIVVECTIVNFAIAEDGTDEEPILILGGNSTGWSDGGVGVEDMERVFFYTAGLLWIIVNFWFMYHAAKHQFRAGAFCGIKNFFGRDSWFKQAEVLEKADNTGDLVTRARYLRYEDKNNERLRKNDKYYTQTREKNRSTLRLRRQQALNTLETMEKQETKLHEDIKAASKAKNWRECARLEKKRWFNYSSKDGKPMPHAKSQHRRAPEDPEPQIISLIKGRTLMN